MQYVKPDGKDGSLDDDISSYLQELKGGGYEGVRIRQVLEMRSGVDYQERNEFSPTNPSLAARNHENALIKNVARFADAARTIHRSHHDTKDLGTDRRRANGPMGYGYQWRTSHDAR